MAQFHTAKIVVRQVSWWFSTLIFQTQKQGRKTHLHVFPYWQSSGVSKTSPLNYHCKSSRVVFCTCGLQLAKGSAFLRGKWTVNSHSCLQLETSETTLQPYSAGRQDMVLWQPGGQQEWPGTAPWHILQVPAHPAAGTLQEAQLQPFTFSSLCIQALSSCSSGFICSVPFAQII